MITNLATLRAAVAGYIDRTDTSTDQLNQFIDNGRRQAARFNAREQEQSALLTLDAQLQADLPAGFKEARAVYTEAGIVVPQNNSVFAAPDDPGYRIIRGKLQAFGNSVLVAGSKLELIYFEYPPALAADGDAGAFLQANADLWLWCAVQDAAAFYRNEALQETAMGRVQDIGGRIEQVGTKGRQYGGPRVMKIRS